MRRCPCLILHRSIPQLRRCRVKGNLRVPLHTFPPIGNSHALPHPHSTTGKAATAHPKHSCKDYPKPDAVINCGCCRLQKAANKARPKDQHHHAQRQTLPRQPHPTALTPQQPFTLHQITAPHPHNIGQQKCTPHQRSRTQPCNGTQRRDAQKRQPVKQSNSTNRAFRVRNPKTNSRIKSGQTQIGVSVKKRDICVILVMCNLPLSHHGTLARATQFTRNTPIHTSIHSRSVNGTQKSGVQTQNAPPFPVGRLHQ